MDERLRSKHFFSNRTLSLKVAFLDPPPPSLSLSLSLSSKVPFFSHVAPGLVCPLVQEVEEENEEDDDEAVTGDHRHWQDDVLLKREFSALVPAFDPRPGHTNVSQIQSLDVPPPGTQTTFLTFSF